MTLHKAGIGGQIEWIIIEDNVTFILSDGQIMQMTPQENTYIENLIEASFKIGYIEKEIPDEVKAGLL